MDNDFIPHIKPLTLHEVEEKGAAVGKLQGKKVAAYKDGDHVRAVSAICTHKFCIIEPDRANSNKNWYCPCHGARYKLTGEVINGPAEKPLPEVKVKVEGGELALDE